MQKAAVVHSLDLLSICHAALRRPKLGLACAKWWNSKVGSRHDVSTPSDQVPTVTIQKLPHSWSPTITTTRKHSLYIIFSSPNTSNPQWRLFTVSLPSALRPRWSSKHCAMSHNTIATYFAIFTSKQNPIVDSLILRPPTRQALCHCSWHGLQPRRLSGRPRSRLR